MMIDGDFKSMNDLVADMIDKCDYQPSNKDNPRTSIHLKEDTFDDLKELKTGTGKSFNDILLELISQYQSAD